MASRVFLDKNEYEKRKSALEAVLAKFENQPGTVAEPDDFKPYAEFAKLSMRTFPLFLKLDDPFLLPRTPRTLYLLPPGTDMPDQRIVVVQYPRTPSIPPQIGLYRWQLGHGLHGYLGGQEGSQNKEIFDLDLPPEHPFNTRPCRIEALNVTSAMLVVRLEFKDGVLTFSVNQSGLQCDWVWAKQAAPPPRIERGSGGNMLPVIKIQRQESPWQDDEILTPDGNEIPLGANRIGRINGADGLPDSEVCYLGADKGEVLRLDKNSKQCSASQNLGGHIEDIVVIPDGNGKAQVIAPCYNGVIYLLSDRGQDNPPQVTHWQAAEELHISRMTAANARNEYFILALDQYHRLWPLQLNDIEAYEKLRDNANGVFAGQLRQHPEIAEPVGSIDDYAPRHLALINAWLWREDTGSKTAFESRLLPHIEALDEVLRQVGDIEGHEAAARAWYSLLKSVWRIWRKERPATTQNANDDHKTRVLELGLKLLNLPVNAPDWLWFKLFREWDLLPRWMKLQEFDPAMIEETCGPIRERIYRMRQAIARRSHELRPLTAYASCRLPGQARHIRALPASPDGKLRFVCVAYAQGLFAFELDPPAHGKTTIPGLRPIAHLPKEKMPWDGMIRSIVVLPDSCSGDPLLVSTQRGECHLVTLKASGFEVSDASQNLNLSISTARLGSYREQRTGTTHWGVLLAGGEPTAGNDALWWLPFNSQGRLEAPRQLYAGTQRGRLRMLAMLENQLWAIDAERGELLHWANLERALAQKTTLGAPQVWWHASGGLYALRVWGEGDAACIICAGHDGMAMAFTALGKHAGRIRWGSGCGTALRRMVQFDDIHGNTTLALAGDSGHLLCFDTDGRLTGMVESVGPVSALARLNAGSLQVLVVGAKSGRLLALTPESTAADATETGEIETNACDPIQHPLRAPRPKCTDLTDQTLELLRSSEPLLFQEGLTRFWHWLDTQSQDTPDLRPDLRDKLAKAERALRLRNQSNPPPNQLDQKDISDSYTHRTALAVRRPCSLHDGASGWPSLPGHSATGQAAALSAWIDVIWQALNEREASDTICPIVDAVLTLGEASLGDDQTCPDAIRTRSEAAWNGVPCNDRAPAPTRRLRLLREAQALRAWRDVARRTQPALAWINRLSQRWDCPPEAADARFKDLAERGIPVTADPGHNEIIWRKLLKNPHDPETLAQTGLAALRWVNAKSGLHAKDIQRLSSYFNPSPAPHQIPSPGAPWALWIKDLTTALQQALAARNSEPPHCAWREIEALEQLAGRVGRSADEQLSADKQLAQAGLIWRALRRDWQTAIETRKRALDELALDPNVNHYLDIRPRYRWENSTRVRVTLELRFRGTRPLQIERALDESSDPIVDSPASLIPADATYHAYDLTLDTERRDELERTLQLACQDYRGVRFTHAISLKDTRGLAGFRCDSAWPQQANRLTTLIDSKSDFAWLRGPDWPEDEHDRLKALVRERYPDTWARVKEVDDIDKALQINAPVFVPDLPQLAQDADSATVLDRLKRLSTLLTWRTHGRASRWFFAVWLRARWQPSPADLAIEQKLKNWLPEAAATRSLLDRLLGEHAWDACATQPGTQPEADALRWICGAGAYGAATLGGLGSECLRQLFAGTGSYERIAEWFGVTSDEVRGLHTHWNTAQRLASTEPAATKDPAKAAAPLLAALFPDAPITLSDGIPGATRPISVLHRNYAHCHVLLPGVRAPDPAPKGLWLTLGDAAPRLSEADGRVVKLSLDAVLVLLSATPSPRADDARYRLNRIAGRQHPLGPETLFQTAAGLEGERIVTGFHGRKKELNVLINAAKQPGGGAVLLIGPRQTGKTTLLQRLSHELAQAGSTLPQIKVEGLNMPTGCDDAKASPFLRWFLARIRDGLRDSDIVINYDWEDSSNPKQRERALEAVEAKLRHQAGKGQCVTLLLDETQSFLEKDIASRYVIGNLLRKWRSDKCVNLIATAFPVGTSIRPSLARHVRDTSNENPWYNLIPDEHQLTLQPWTPRETRDFFSPRLAGFGVELSDGLPEQIIGLSRGVPWKAQTLGLRICEYAEQIYARKQRLLTAGDWSQIAYKTRNAFRDQVHDRLRNLAAELDREAKLDAVTNPQASLQRGKLAQALFKQIPQDSIRSPNIDADHWPPCTAFDREKFKLHLPQFWGDAARLDHLLETLCQDQILAPASRGRDGEYEFWADQLPLLHSFEHVK